MYRIDGHQLVVNEYYAECLRKAKEQEAERDESRTHAQDQTTDPVPTTSKEAV